MRINHNIAALNTYSRLNSATQAQGKSLEKLSSGQRINKAGDDAAGLAISEKMRNQIRGLDQASRNAQDGISMIQTAEGALGETHSMLLRMRELTVQANNGTNGAQDVAKIQTEIDELISEITETGNRTEFNEKKLINGTLGVGVKDGTLTNAILIAKGVTVEYSGIKATDTVTFATNGGSSGISVTVGGTTQTIAGISTLTSVVAGTTLNFDKVGVKITLGPNQDISTMFAGTNLLASGTSADLQIGANKSQTLSISISDMRSAAIGTGASFVSEVNVSNAGQTFDQRLGIIDGAIGQVSTQRAKIGAWQNRLDHTISNLSTSSENLTAAESRIRDVDMAKEMMEFTKNNILNQAATAMLAQANQQPQGVLQLLR